MVEIAFGRLKARWRRLLKQNDMHIEKSLLWFCVCVCVCVCVFECIFSPCLTAALQPQRSYIFKFCKRLMASNTMTY